MAEPAPSLVSLFSPGTDASTVCTVHRNVHYSVHVVCITVCTTKSCRISISTTHSCHSTGLGYSILLTTMNRFTFPILFLILHSTDTSIARSGSIKKARPRKDLFEVNNDSGFYLKLKLLINLKLTVKSEAFLTLSF